MKRRPIAALIEKILDEEHEVMLSDGTVALGTVEEALIRTTVKRALDVRSKLGMEAMRFVTEYVYGKPDEKKKVEFSVVDAYEEMSDEELLIAQEDLMKKALHGSHIVTPKDPARFIEAGRASEIVQHLVDTGRDTQDVSHFSGRNRDKRQAEEERIQKEDEEGFTWPEGTDELLTGRWG